MMLVCSELLYDSFNIFKMILVIMISGRSLNLLISNVVVGICIYQIVSGMLTLRQLTFIESLSFEDGRILPKY